jgi:hypothetical protein
MFVFKDEHSYKSHKAYMSRILQILVAASVLTVSVDAFASTQSRTFNDVGATFHIKTPVVKLSENLKVEVIYSNTGKAAVTFRYSYADVDAEIYRKGAKEPLLRGCIGEYPFFEVTLKPLQSVRLEETIYLHCWDALAPGHYEIRFYYHLGLLRDESLAKKYQRMYPHDFYVVAWEDRRHPFRIAK